MATATNNDATARTIGKAIDNADDKTLRAILKSMCKDSEACREEVIARMLVSQKHEVIEIDDSSEDEGKKHQSKKRKKRKTTADAPISRFEVCETCEKTYDVTLNNDQACQTHDDILEIDEEYFPDDDQVQYDLSSIDVETDWRRKTCPEGFVWQCCDEPSNGKPCVISRHTPKKR